MILLIEDDDRTRHAFGGLLRTNGFRVMEATDARDARALMDKWVFKLVISDLFLPDTRGFELVDLIRARYPTTPLIVMSGYLSQPGGEAILGESARFLQKPVATETLIETVQRLLSTE
jgi:DNA-binding NtrC family response regulator